MVERLLDDISYALLRTNPKLTANVKLVSNGADFDLETLDLYVKATYPDLRKTINTVQMNVVDSKIQDPKDSVGSTDDWKIQIVGLFRENKVREARKLICSKVRQDEYDEMFQFMYRNLEFFGATEDQQDEAVIIIRNGMVKHTQVADPEINLSATLIELEQISK